MNAQSLGSELLQLTLCVFAIACMLVAANWGGYHKGHEAGMSAGIRREQDRAIGAGVGRWTVDPESGEKQFVYGASK